MILGFPGTGAGARGGGILCLLQDRDGVRDRDGEDLDQWLPGVREVTDL